MRVLIIEDNQRLARNLVMYLIARDIHVDVAYNWSDGLLKSLNNFYDIILLDINLPDINGVNICKKIRERGEDVYIMMLTSMWTNDDIIDWLNSWADDYLVKPFEYDQLLARMNAILRRKLSNKSNTILSIWEIIIDIQKIEVTNKWEVVKLSALEYELLKYLIQNRGKALSREEIYNVVWGETDEDFIRSKTIDVYIWYLRKKFWSELIETKKGFWFLMK